jgi:putative Mg2+ transporter-C (MgtC) family protein
MNAVDFALRLLVAVSLGAAIGMERQWRQRLAGLRTNALVSTGAAAFVAISGMITNDNSPTRIAAQVVSGIGFLGAGLIFREGAGVRGLNTAATLWCSAAAGSLAGLGFYLPATITAAVVVGAHVFLRPLGRTLDSRPVDTAEVEVHYRLEATCLDRYEQHLRTLLLQALTQAALPLRGLSSRDTDAAHRVLIRAEVVTNGRQDRLIEQVTSRLSVEPGLSAVSWEISHQEANGG